MENESIAFFAALPFVKKKSAYTSKYGMNIHTNVHTDTCHQYYPECKVEPQRGNLNYLCQLQAQHSVKSH